MITGSVVSDTITSRVTSEVLPNWSVAEYVIVYSPIRSVLTSPVIITSSPPSETAPGSI